MAVLRGHCDKRFGACSCSSLRPLPVGMFPRESACCRRQDRGGRRASRLPSRRPLGLSCHRKHRRPEGEAASFDSGESLQQRAVALAAIGVVVATSPQRGGAGGRYFEDWNEAAVIGSRADDGASP
jgi:hypothetical protein